MANISDHDESDHDGSSRPESSQSKRSSRSSRSRSSRGSSKRSSNRGGLDDITIRQMFRRYLCSPSKETEVIKQQLQIIQRELNLILDEDENYNSEDFSDSG